MDGWLTFDNPIVHPEYSPESLQNNASALDCTNDWQLTGFFESGRMAPDSTLRLGYILFVGGAVLECKSKGSTFYCYTITPSYLLNVDTKPGQHKVGSFDH